MSKFTAATIKTRSMRLNRRNHKLMVHAVTVATLKSWLRKISGNYCRNLKNMVAVAYRRNHILLSGVKTAVRCATVTYGYGR
jgi:hypothetical protein